MGEILYLPTSRLPPNELEEYRSWMDEVEEIFWFDKLNIKCFDFNWVDAFKQDLSSFQAAMCASEQFRIESEELKMDENFQFLEEELIGLEAEIILLPTSRIKTGIKNFRVWKKQVDFELVFRGLFLIDFDYDWIGAYLRPLSPETAVNNASIAHEDEHHSI